MRSPVTCRSRRFFHRLAWVGVLALAACGAGAAVAAPPDADGPNGGAPGRFPAALAGGWYAGATGSTNYYDAATGGWSNPSGTGNVWTFAADGRYTHAVLWQVSAYGCVSRVFVWDTGTAAATATHVTFRSAGATLTSESNCDASLNYEKPVAGAAGTAPYTLGADGGGRPTLTFVFSDATEAFTRR